MLSSNIAISKAQASTLNGLRNDFLFSVRFRGFLSFQHSSQNNFPYTINVAISTNNPIGEFAVVYISNVVQTMPTSIIVTTAVSRPVLLEVIYTHSSGVSRDIDWKFVFTYATGGAAANFVFLPSPIVSNFGDTSGLYSVYAEAVYSTPSTLSVALGETETSREWMTCMANLTSVEILNVNKFLFFDDKKRAAASLLLQKYVIRKSFSLQVGDSFQIARTVEVYFLEL